MPNSEEPSLKNSIGSSLRPDLLTPSQCLDLIGKEPRIFPKKPLGDHEIELDVFSFGLILEYDVDSDEDGYFPSAIYVRGSDHDLKDEIETFQPKVYKQLCSHIHETHNQQ